MFFDTNVCFCNQSGQSIEEDLSGTGTFAIEFGVHTFTAQCSYWSEKEDEWRTDGCVVSTFTVSFYLVSQPVLHDGSSDRSFMGWTH